MSRILLAAVVFPLLFAFPPRSLKAHEGAGFAFRRLTTEDGLASNSVVDLFQDSRGFIWVGTEYGVGRYDGYDFKTFRHVMSDTTGLVGNRVRAIGEDARGRIIVGTESGVSVFDRNTETFRTLVVDGGTVQVTSMLVESNDLTWIGTLSDGLVGLWIEDDREVTSTVKLVGDELPGEGVYAARVNDLARTRDGRLWVGTHLGLAFTDGRTVTDVGLAEGVLTLEAAVDGNLWIGTETGLKFLDSSTLEVRPVLNGFAVTSVFERDRDLWIGTRSHGIYLLDRKTGQARVVAHDPDDETTIGTGTIYRILRDRSGMLWVGSYDGGVSLLRPERSAMRSLVSRPDDPGSLSSSSVFSVLRDRAGVLWVGTDAGLNRLGEGDRVDRVYGAATIGHAVVRALHEDGEGRFWVGTDGGLALLDRETGEARVYTHDPDDPASIQDNVIRSIYEDDDEILWVGTNVAGLHRFDPASGRFSTLDSTRTYARNVRQTYGDTAGAIWIAAGNLLRYDPSVPDWSVVYWNDPEDPTSLAVNSVYCVLAAGDGGMWVGTYNGLQYLDTKTGEFTLFNEQDGLASSIIYNIIQDARGDLWVSTNRGISQVAVSRSAGRITVAVRNYDTANGVAGTDFNSGAWHVDPDGTIYFGGMSGLTFFHPDSLRGESVRASPVVFTGLSIFTAGHEAGKPPTRFPGIAERDRIRLPSDVTHLSVSFACLDFTDPGRNAYAYRLEGLDPSWVDLGQQRQLNLSLSPGQYTLHVIAANSDGVWNRQGRKLVIDVAAPIWRRGWFIGLSVLGIGIVLAGGHRLRMRRVRERAAELDDLVEKLEDRNAELERFTYTVSHDLKSPLVTIKGFAGLIERDADKPERLKGDVTRIVDAADQMLLLLDDLLELSRVGRVRNESVLVPLIDIVEEAVSRVQGRIDSAGANVTVSPDLPEVRVDRQRVIEVFQNLVDNAVKFAGRNARVVVGMRKHTEPPVFYVSDNGPGIDPRYHEKVFGLFERLDQEIEGTGIGLALVHRIIELHEGRIWVESSGEGKGATFCFTLEGNGGEAP